MADVVVDVEVDVVDPDGMGEDRDLEQPLPSAVTLPKGQAFALLEGGRLFKLRLPLPDASHDPAMPASLSAMAADMAKRYKTGEKWWDEAAVLPIPAATGTAPSMPASVTADDRSLAMGRAAIGGDEALMDGANGARGT